MGGSETTEILRTYTIRSNTIFDHGVPDKVISGIAEMAPAVTTTRHNLAVAPKATGDGVEAGVCRKCWVRRIGASFWR